MHVIGKVEFINNLKLKSTSINKTLTKTARLTHENPNLIVYRIQKKAPTLGTWIQTGTQRKNNL